MYGSVTAVVYYVHDMVVVILRVAKANQKNLGENWEILLNYSMQQSPA
jgi:hypothetical protein